MLEAIATALRGVDPVARKHLSSCVPVLQSVLQQWDGRVPAGGFALACATPRHAVVLRAPYGWPDFDAKMAAKFDQADAALGLLSAIEASPSVETTDLIVVSTCGTARCPQCGGTQRGLRAYYRRWSTAAHCLDD